jgi:hypothetical protein
MASGTLFLIFVIVGFGIFATQAGAKESKIHLSFGGWFFLLFIGIAVLWALMGGTGIAFMH